MALAAPRHVDVRFDTNCSEFMCGWSWYEANVDVVIVYILGTII